MMLFYEPKGNKKTVGRLERSTKAARLILVVSFPEVSVCTKYCQVLSSAGMHTPALSCLVQVSFPPICHCLSHVEANEWWPPIREQG